MLDALFRIGILVAIFASVFLFSQLVLNSIWTRGIHRRAVNKRLSLLKQGASSENVMATLLKNTPKQYPHLPPLIGKRLESLQRMLMAAVVPLTLPQLLFSMAVVFVLLTSVLLLFFASSGFPMNSGTFVMTGAVSFCVSFAVPLFILSFMAQRRRKKIEQQFPIALDVFVRALRAGHPVAGAIELLTNEMEDPIGSEFGLIGDEVSYGAELTEALGAMADRWDLDDIRMFVVSLSVQTETGGNLAEILENLADVIRSRASLYMKVRALSSEGRMTGWMLTALPIFAFLGLFAVNPEFYLSVAQETMFIVGAIILLAMYISGFLMIRMMINIKV